MKSIKFLSIAVLGAILLFSSCEKDDGTQPANPDDSASSFFSAKVDNQAFPKAHIDFTVAKFFNSTKTLQILGQPEDRKETIVLTLMPFSGKVTTAADWKPGTYDFDPIHITNLEYLASAGYNKWNGNGYDGWNAKWEYVKSGKIIITSNTGTHIKGTFSFDAVRQNNDGTFNASNVKKITEGKFDVEIKNQ